MFSGIIEEMGVVNRLDRNLGGVTLSVLAREVLSDLYLGASLNVSGTCLTVVASTEQDFSVDLSVETLQVTTLGALVVGSAVNLERAMKIHERIGGHLVTGHIDGIGVIREREQHQNTLSLAIEAPEEILRYCMRKGSITVDGISLTINTISDKRLSVAIIPHTAKVTTLGMKQPGDAVNLEADVIGKYVERLLQTSGYLLHNPPPSIDREYLQKRGLL